MIRFLVRLLAPSPAAVEPYLRLLRYLRPHKWLFAWSLVALVAYGMTDGAVPFLVRSILDDVFGEQNRRLLWVLLGALLLFGFIRGIFGFLQQYLTSLVGLRVVEDIRNDINRHLLFLSPAFFSQRASGDLIATVTNDTVLVRSAITEVFASLLRDTIRVIALLTAALYLDPVLGVLALIGFPLGFYPVIRFGKRVRRLSRSGQDQFGRLTGLLQESIQGHKVVRAFNMENFEHARFVEENRRVTDTLSRAAKYGALATPVNEFIACGAVALVLLYGGMSVMRNARTPGDFLAFITAMFLLYEPLKKLGRLNTQLQTALAAAERVFSILDTPPAISDRPGARRLSLREPSVEYVGVYFRYPSREPLPPNSVKSGVEPWTLSDVSLRVRPGETVALVGMSGGGKSTLVSLLLRFYEPERGEILIDGVNIRDVTLHSLREALSLVTQHTFLFNDTVFNNIRYGRRGATPEEVYAAAEAANADAFIRRLPNGYDTTIGEQGYTLSGGERARIAIARALLKNAPILILDEATAALDSESEALVQAAIDRLMEGRTVLVIAHRLATVRKAHLIAVMSHGQIVERGTHEELLEKNGEYAKYYRMQFREQPALRAVRGR